MNWVLCVEFKELVGILIFEGCDEEVLGPEECKESVRFQSVTARTETPRFPAQHSLPASH